MDPEVEDLVRAERLIDAARLASERGDPHQASLLFERACDWPSAAREAAKAGERRRAMDSPSRQADEALAEAMFARLEGQPGDALAAATRLSGRGRDAWVAAAPRGRRRLRGRRRGVGSRRRPASRRRAPRARRRRRLGGESPRSRRSPRSARIGPRWSRSATLLSRFGKARGGGAVSAARARRCAGATRGSRAPGAASSSASGFCVPPPTRPASSRRSANRQYPRRPPFSRAGPTRGSSAATRSCARRPPPRAPACSSASTLVQGDRVAVKVFAAWNARAQHATRSPGSSARSARCARSTTRTSCPSGSSSRRGRAIVLAWMGGGTLERLLAATGSLPPARAVESRRAC